MVATAIYPTLRARMTVGTYGLEAMVCAICSITSRRTASARETGALGVGSNMRLQYGSSKLCSENTRGISKVLISLPVQNRVAAFSVRLSLCNMNVLSTAPEMPVEPVSVLTGSFAPCFLK